MDVESLRTAFGKRYGAVPTHLARAPGRVHLMGEELEHHGLPVLSLALSREARLALRPRDDGEVCLQDLRPGGGEISFQVGVAPEGGGAGELATLLRQVARLLARRFAVWRGFDAVLASDVPPGLGASAALRVAAAVSLAEVGEVGVDALALAGLLAEEAEEPGAPVAVAVSLGARAGRALQVVQDPLRTRAVMLPADWRVVVAPASAGPEAPASPAWREQRRLECREGLQRLGEHLVSAGRVRKAPDSWPAVFRAQGGPDRALLLGEEALSGALLKRFRYLAGEARRTREAEDAILLADLHAMGALMDASHGSLRGDYLASSVALDRTAALALEGGAAGAHLTGGGRWVVALADVGTVDGVLEVLGQEPRSGLGAAFVAEPASGASFGPFPG